MRFTVYVFFVLFSTHSFANEIITPWGESPHYISEVFSLALSYSPNKNYKAVPYKTTLPKKRAINLISTNQGVDIIASGSTTERHNLLLPIQFPLMKGLYGWRIALVPKENQHILKNIHTLDDLKTLSAGQLHSWSDTEILEKNNLKVVKGSHYEGLFSMLANKHFDYFPRSIIEVEWEYQANKILPIMVDKHSLIHYPTAYYFYVNKNNTTLAKDLKKGLEAALKDGQLERLFNKHYGDIIDKVKTEKRHIIQLKNPLLPNSPSLNRPELWLDFSQN